MKKMDFKDFEEDTIKQFWSLRKRIYLFRKLMAVKCFIGLLSQTIAIFVLGSDHIGYFGLLVFGMILVASGAYFLFKGNQHVTLIDIQGDRLFSNPNWRNEKH